MIIHLSKRFAHEVDTMFMNDFIKKSKMAEIISPAVVAKVLYTEVEGGHWKPYYSRFYSEEEIKKICEAQSKPEEDPRHKVRLPGGIKAAAILFHDGVIWDAILSGYDTNRKRGLPKCYPKRY